MHGRSRSTRLGREGRFQNDQLLAPCRKLGMPMAGLPQTNKYDRKDSPAEKGNARESTEACANEGSRRFKSAPLRQRALVSGISLGQGTVLRQVISFSATLRVKGEASRSREQRAPPFLARRPAGGVPSSQLCESHPAICCGANRISRRCGKQQVVACIEYSDPCLRPTYDADAAPDISASKTSLLEVKGLHWYEACWQASGLHVLVSANGRTKFPPRRLAT
jgi:hypothetical protein